MSVALKAQGTGMKTRILLLTTLFLYNFSASLYSNSLPLVILALGLGPVEVSLSSFIINIVFIAFASYAGSLGDKTGARRAMMIIGVIFLLLALTLVFSAYNYMSVLIASAISGLASAFFSSNAVMAVVEAGSSSGELRPEVSIAHAGLASGSGWFLGLLLGGILVRVLGLRNALIFGIPIAILSILALLFSQGPLIGLEREIIAKPYTIFFGIAERIRILFLLISKMGNPFKSAMKKGPYDPFKLYLLAMMLAFLAVSLFFTQIPVYMRRILNVPNGNVMLLMSIHNGISTAIFALLGFSLVRIEQIKALELALALRSLAFSLPLLALTYNYIVVLSTTFLITGITWALINVSMNSIALNLGGMERGGERLGQLNGSISIGIVIGSLVSGIIVKELGFVVNFILSSIIMILALIWVRFILKR